MQKSEGVLCKKVREFYAKKVKMEYKSLIFLQFYIYSNKMYTVLKEIHIILG